MRLPTPRGPLSSEVFARLADTSPFVLDPVLADLLDRATAVEDPVRDDDLQVTLWAAYELAYRGFEDVDAAREWDPEVLRLRGRLAATFEAELLRRVPRPSYDGDAEAARVADRLREVVEESSGPPLVAHLHREADLDQLLEFLRHRSLYHRKESDPHAFVLPRIDGRPKVALAELLYDEYGGGRPAALHSTLYADALVGAGLDPAYGAYVDQTPASTLAVNNLMSLLCLERRWRGAALGHLAAFETTSAVPCRRIAAGLERVGLPDVVAAYFHEHVEADSVHEQVALRDVCGALVETEPGLAEDVLFGAAACLALDAVAAEDLLASWQVGEPHLGAAS